LRWALSLLYSPDLFFQIPKRIQFPPHRTFRFINDMPCVLTSNLASKKHKKTTHHFFKAVFLPNAPGQEEA